MIRRSILRFGVPIAILAVAVSFAGYLRATRPEVKPRAPQERVWTVAAVSVDIADAQPRLRLYGEVVSGRTVDLRPEVAGRVIETGPGLVEGGVVRAGERLVVIDPFDYEANVVAREAELAEARARLRELEADLAGARALLERDSEQVELRRRDVERRRTLRGSGAGTAKALDDARLALSEAVQRRLQRKQTIERLAAALEQQRAVIARREVALRRARRDLERTRLEAPFDGFIVAVDTAVGKWVNVGDRVARLIDAARLEVKFHVSRRDFARLLAGGGYRGRVAEVIWRGRAGEIPYRAVIDRIASEVDPASGGVKLYARVEGGGVETVLRPGAFVEVFVADRRFKDVARLPAVALHGADTVYVVAEGRLQPRKVRVVARTGGDILVKGELRTGDRVVTIRFPEIGPGLKVRVQ